MLTKVCSKYCRPKSILDFYKDPRGHLGLYEKCKACHLLYSKTEKSRKVRNAYKLKMRSNPSYVKKEREKGRLRMRSYFKDPDRKNKFRENHRRYISKRARANISFKIRKNPRVRLCGILRGKIKGGSSVSDLGCSIEFFKNYIESKFYNNPISNIAMTWENWGQGKNKWSLDYIRELSLFDLSKREEFLEACNYKNLQPLWFEDSNNKTINFVKKEKENGIFF